jgi:hypothetical protein
VIRLISIDPGTVNLGWAAWDGLGRLVAAGCSRTVRTKSLDGKIDAHATALFRDAWKASEGRMSKNALDVLVERMQIDGRQVPPKDLLDVQAVGFAVAGLLGARVVSHPPSRWKGSIPKDIHHMRIRAELEEHERRILDEALAGVPKANRKEVLDAVGLGCYHLKRTTRSGATRRQ